VERAGYRGASDDTIRERTAIVRTAILDGEKTVAGVEHREGETSQLDGAAFPRRNILGGSNANPVHTDTASIG
jgi:hypothetical protein